MTSRQPPSSRARRDPASGATRPPRRPPAHDRTPPPAAGGWTPDDDGPPDEAPSFVPAPRGRRRRTDADAPVRPLPGPWDPGADGGLNGERIAKHLARVGVCSRRDAERLIADGRVRLNGTVLDTPAVKVTEADIVMVDGRRVGAREEARLWRYHKPAGLVTTHRDPQGRPTVFEHLPADLPRVVSVGRLDLTSEGLLLLTNSGEMARVLEHPASGFVRTYRARAFGFIDQHRLDLLAEGIEVEGVRYGPIQAVLDATRGANSWITLSLSEGKNREVRRVLQALGLRVNRLIRVSYGPFLLGQLAEGAVDEIPRRVLREHLGGRVRLD